MIRKPATERHWSAGNARGLERGQPRRGISQAVPQILALRDGSGAREGLHRWTTVSINWGVGTGIEAIPGIFEMVSLSSGHRRIPPQSSVGGFVEGGPL